MKFSFRWLGVGLGLGLALSSLPLPLAANSAHSAKGSDPKTAVKPASFTPPPIPSGVGRPGKRRAGGASRGSCSTVQSPRSVQAPLSAPLPITANSRYSLTALVTVTSNSSSSGSNAALPNIAKSLNSLAASSVDYVWGYTLMEHPVFWFYMPYTRDEAIAEFVIQDEEKNTNILEPINITLPDRPGIIAIQLPKTVSLVADKPYSWFLEVYYCNPQKDSPPDAVQGTVMYRKPAPGVLSQIANQTWAEQVNWYANQGIWYDAMTILGKQRQQNPQDSEIQKRWAQLLQEAGLAEFSTTPIVSEK